MVGVGRDRSALDRLLRLGADAVVALRADESADDLAARLSEAAGPVDVVLDGLYGIPVQAALQCCAPHGRVVNIGNPAGSAVLLPAGLLRSKQLTLTGFAGLHISLAAKRDALTWLWRQVGDDESNSTSALPPFATLPPPGRRSNPLRTPSMSLFQAEDGSLDQQTLASHA